MSGKGNVVHVKGYTRANGTYVAPHTRSAPQRHGGSTANAGGFTSGVSHQNRSIPQRHSSSGLTSANVVHVNGYTKADGTYVAPHTRSAPQRHGCSGFTSDVAHENRLVPQSHSSNGIYVAPYTRSAPQNHSSSHCGFTSPGVVHVSGYTRADGTYVAPYTRSAPQSRTSSGFTSNVAHVGGSAPQRHCSIFTSSDVVHVNGYTRSDGTNVASYTRSAPQSRSSSHCGLTSPDVVHVSGYTRANGTYVAPYTRSAPQNHNSSKITSADAVHVMRSDDTYVAPRLAPRAQSHSSSFSSDVVHVSGYTRANGTYVAPYTRSAPQSHTGSSSGFTSANEVLVNEHTRADGNYVAPTILATQSHISSGYASDMSEYMRSDGTYVAPYARSIFSHSSSGYTSDVSGYTKSDSTSLDERSTAGSSAFVEPSTRSEPTTSNAASRVYVDNAYNRKLSRVGKPIGTHVSRATRSDYYSENPNNRRLDRVGKPTSKWGYRPKKIMENYTITEVRIVLEGLAIVDEPWQDYQYTHDYLQQLEVEENWRWRGINVSTNIPFLDYCASLRQKLIPYEKLMLKNEIGRGGFGVVVAGLWHNTAIAFKKLHYSQMSKKRLDIFLSEVTILSSLNHSHTVKLFGAVADTDNSCVGFVMEYLRRSLFKAIFIDDCKFTDDKKKGIVSQMADALVYLHDNKRIAHCDIKSENILLDSNDDVKLADFGLSTMKNATETTQSVPQAGQGTARYSAPEVLRGDMLTKSQLFPTDIYSLAIVVFEVIVEEEPFDGLNLKQLERHVGNGDLRPTSENTSMDDSLKKLLYQCWDRVASKRPKAKEFQEKWRCLMDSNPLVSSTGL